MALEFQDNLTKNVKLHLSKLNKKIDGVLLDSAKKIIIDSKDMTPVDTGFLRKSHYRKMQRNSQERTVEVGLTAYYATTVHERVDIPHRVGRSKFLETSINQNLPEIKKSMIEALKVK